MRPAAHTHARRAVLLTLRTMASAPPANGVQTGANAAAAAPAAPPPAAGGSGAAGTSSSPPAGTRHQDTAPLSAVVKDAVRRWYEDALREAERGDVVSCPETGGDGGDFAAPFFQPSRSFPLPSLLPPHSPFTEAAGPPLPDADRGVRLHARPGRGGAVGGPRAAAGLPHGGRVLHDLNEMKMNDSFIFRHLSLCLLACAWVCGARCACVVWVNAKEPKK